MTGYINVICQSLILSIVMVFFLVEDCKDKKSGFIIYFLLELMNNYILFRILWLTEAGIALPQVIVWRIILYVVYTTFRLGWFRVFVKDCYREFLLIYFYLWVVTYTVVSGGLILGIRIIFPEELAVDAISTMPKTYAGLTLHIICSFGVVIVAVWLKNRNWLQRLSTNFLCILFAFIYIFADVGSTFLLAKPYMKSEIYLQIAMVNIIFLLAASYFGYVNYLRTTGRQENEKIQRAIERQYRSYEILSRKESKIRRVRHDLANYLQIIKELEGNEKEDFSTRYQEQLRALYEEIAKNDEAEIYGEKKTKKILGSSAWGIFTVFVVDILMVIIVSRLVLYKVFTYESIIIMQFVLIFFITLYVWLVFRRTKKENRELSKKINSSMESPDITRLVGEIDEIINNLKFISVQEEERLLEQLDGAKFAVITGNHVFDSMLWHKKRTCSELGIELEIEWNFSEYMGIEDMDIIGLMGNLLDNAIEACSRMEDRERIIRVKSKSHANIMSIRVKNTKNEQEEPVKHRFKTMKKDAENHGMGMKIIQNIVNKYDGTIQYYDEKTEFTVIVNLQVD